jgi:D-glycero-D-manno-heptose 1,7-bisphosphate phosphatase
MPRAVFLDRDGVLNEPVVREGKPYPPATAGELRIVEGAADALARLRAHGFLLIVVTNQPDIARGTTTRAAVDAIHARLAVELPLDEIAVCPHDDRDRCRCRKPLPGLVTDSAGRHGIDLAASYLVGDRWRDIDAGAAAGCRTVLIDRGYRERAAAATPDAVVATLPEAAAWILSDSGCFSTTDTA